MITMMLAQVFIQTAILCGILFILARHEADYGFHKVAMVTAGCVAGTAVLEALLVDHLGAFTILPVIALITFMIMKFCWINLWKSILVVVVFLACHVGFAIVGNRISTSMDEGMIAASPVDAEDMKLAIEFHKQVAATLGDEPVPTNTPPATQPIAEVPAPAAPEPDVSANEWNAAYTTLKFGGTMSGRGGQRLALCNGRTVKVGDSVRATHNGRVFRWKVKQITTSDIKLEKQEVRPVAENKQ